MNSSPELKHFFAAQKPLNTIIKSFLCFEQPETIHLLKYICLQEEKDQSDDLDQGKKSQKLIFNSQLPTQQEGKESKRIKKQKQFTFNGVFMHEQKMKHYFCQEIQQICSKAITGVNQNILIYGTDEKNKDKMLFGQSQNPGLFMSTLWHIFQYCHEKGLQDLVTLKLSAIIHKDGKFIDIFSNGEEAFLQNDEFQKLILQTCPQIILRNVKTGLKVLNLMIKIIKEIRQTKLTENLIMTLKLEIDWQKGPKDEQPNVYTLSKINFIKLANPSVNDSLMGVNKDNIWFVNLFNYLKNPKNSEKLDNFTLYLKEIVFESSHYIYCFISLSNKMSSNQCLTALLFSNYVKSLKVKAPQLTLINLPKLYGDIAGLAQIAKHYNLQKSDHNIIRGFFQRILESQNIHNYLEYQYSLVIGEACEKLSKYIFTEQLQDFYYAKKIEIVVDEDLLEAYQNFNKINLEIAFLKKKMLKALEMKSQQGSKLLCEKTKQNLDKIISMAQHFLIQDIHITSILQKLGINRQLEQNNQEKTPVPRQIQIVSTFNETNTNPFIIYKQNKQNISKQQCNKINSLNLKTITQRQNDYTKRVNGSNISQPQQFQAKQYSNKIEGVKDISEGQKNICDKKIRKQSQGLQPIKDSSQQKALKSKKCSPNKIFNRSAPKDNLTYMFTNKQVGLKNQANRF